MINPEDTRQQGNLRGKQRQKAEMASQHDELSYLSALAFEQFDVGREELERLEHRIDKRWGGKSGRWQAIVISLFIGLFTGISVFFVIFHKNQTHPSVYQSLENDEVKPALNTVKVAADTLFPEIAQPITKKEEHFRSVSNQATEQPAIAEAPETMSIKPVELPETKPEEEEDIILGFSPNAPVIFISNLKVTNYRLYYFRQSQTINLSVNTGLAAQYENKANVERQYINHSESFLAHKIIQRAMKLFGTKHYVNCIEELNMLYEFNKSDANAQFYLGMCYYLTGKYSTAQVFFQKNLDNENNIFHQESDFYLAMCLLQTKQADKALVMLQAIAEAKGFYSERARSIIAKQR